MPDTAQPQARAPEASHHAATCAGTACPCYQEGLGATQVHQVPPGSCPCGEATTAPVHQGTFRVNTVPDLVQRLDASLAAAREYLATHPPEPEDDQRPGRWDDRVEPTAHGTGCPCPACARGEGPA